MINFVHIFVVDPLGMDYSTTAITDRYNLMYSIKAYDILHPTVNYDISSGGGRPLPDNTIMLDKEQNKVRTSLVDRKSVVYAFERA